MNELEVPTTVRVSGALMMVAAAWNLFIGLTFLITWVSTLIMACVAVLYIPLLILNAMSGLAGLRLLLGHDVPNAKFLALASSGMGFIFYCGLAAVAPDGAAALLLQTRDNER